MLSRWVFLLHVSENCSRPTFVIYAMIPLCQSAKCVTGLKHFYAVVRYVLLSFYEDVEDFEVGGNVKIQLDFEAFITVGLCVVLEALSEAGKYQSLAF